MARKKWQTISLSKFLKTPVKENPCKECSGFGWKFFKNQQKNQCTVLYKEYCTKCRGSGSNGIVSKDNGGLQPNEKVVPPKPKDKKATSGD